MSIKHGESQSSLAIGDVRREERGTSGGRWVASLDGHEAEMTYSRASAVLSA